MAKPNLRIATADEAPTSRTRSPEREALASAVERHNEVKRRLAAIEAAKRTAKLEYNAALTACGKASKAIEDAAAGAAQHRVDRVLGIRGPTPKSAQYYRAKLQEADDQRAASQSAQNALLEQRKEAENSLVIVRLSLDGRIQDVLKAEAPVEKVIAEYHVAHRDFIRHQQLLEWLDSKHAIAPDRFWQKARGESVDGTAHWETAVAALEKDPDAPLPS